MDRLSEDLVSEGVVTSDQLAVARLSEVAERKSLAAALVDLGFVSERKLLGAIGRHLEIPEVDLAGYIIDSETVGMISEAMARKHTLIALFRVQDTLTVAMANPLDIFALDDLKRESGLDVTPVLATQASVETAIDEYYGGSRAISEVVSGMDSVDLDTGSTGKISAAVLERLTQQAPIVRLVNELVLQAVKEGASDIHIEPGAADVSTRYRIDGVLRKVASFPSSLMLPVVSRIKVMAEMDLVERRLPQDGRIQVKVGDRDVDLRVSTFPSIQGEKVVMRVLDRGKIRLDIAALGFSAPDLARLRKALLASGGLILLCGPTGCGKTTTLYSMLCATNYGERSVVTLEDPVEYRLDHVTQGQVDAKKGLTFADGLRAILRQDPDIVMVGEMRDLETAELAVRAALTGHLVLSTLHTLSAPATLARLVDMGIDPYLVASSVGMVVAQRLVRKICARCKEAYPAPLAFAERLGGSGDGPLQFYRGKGCKACGHTGYKGRTALYELMPMGEEIRPLVLAKAHADEIARASAQAGNRSLEEDGYAKVLGGITTLDELIRETRRWQ